MNELDDLLKSLRAEEPKPQDIQKWKKTAQMIKPHFKRRWVELAVAMLVGILIGSTVFKSKLTDENYTDDATVEHILTKVE